MGILADSLFSVLMSWVRALVSGIWALFSSEHTTVLEFLGKNWIMIAVVLIAAGLVIDWLIWMVRWQPYHIWAQRVRRILGIEHGEEEDEEEELRAHAADYPRKKQPVPQRMEEEEMVNDLYIDEQQEKEAVERANDVPDEVLGAYPGMRYGTTAAEKPDGSTQRYSALTSEGPGSAEVARRRAEIDAWQKQIQDEARQRAQAERAAREAAEEAERRAREEAERRAAEEAERRAREEAERRAAEEAERKAREEAAREAAEEAERRAAEEAERRAAEEAERRAAEERLAQEQYARELAEYERAKAQYERELAEYERQKAQYDAQMAQLAAQQEQASRREETAGEIAPEQAVPSRRRRASVKTYSDYVAGEEVTMLPPAPQWPEKTAARKNPKTAASKKAAHKGTPKKNKPASEHKLLGTMAKMIEPQEEEISSYMTLPPRVDMHDAYKPAKMPQKTERRRR